MLFRAARNLSTQALGKEKLGCYFDFCNRSHHLTLAHGPDDRRWGRTPCLDSCGCRTADTTVADQRSGIVPMNR